MKNSSEGTEFVAGAGSGIDGLIRNDHRRRRLCHRHHLKLIRNQKKLLDVITELKSRIEELQHTLAQQTVTIATQNTRLEAAENDVMSIYTRDMTAILARGGTRSGSNQTSPDQTSAFM
ncbi:hypothetical protein ACFE04_031244 [Oxalis oulophora]